MTKEEQVIKVSVCMITYNHAAYIEQAIESIMEQQADFLYELVIGEDGSTDATREICLKLKDKYHDRIILLPEAPNKGANPNFLDVYKACRGNYIAMCEGDDYWIDPLKLQKQANVLDENMDVSLTFHNVWVYNQNNDMKNAFGQYTKNIYTFNDIAGKWLISTPSVMYRKQLVFPSWFSKLFYGDIVIYLMNAQLGKLFYIDEIIAVYRVHGTSATNSLSAEANFKKLIGDYSFMLSSFSAPYKKIIRRELGFLYWKLARTQLNGVSNSRAEAEKNVKKYIQHTLQAGYKVPLSAIKTYLSLVLKRNHS